jgi:hypothetical protein
MRLGDVGIRYVVYSTLQIAQLVERGIVVGCVYV